MVKLKRRHGIVRRIIAGLAAIGFILTIWSLWHDQSVMDLLVASLACGLAALAAAFRAAFGEDIYDSE